MWTNKRLKKRKFVSCDPLVPDIFFHVVSSGAKESSRRHLPVWAGGLGSVTLHLQDPEHLLCSQPHQVGLSPQTKAQSLCNWLISETSWMSFNLITVVFKRAIFCRDLFFCLFETGRDELPSSRPSVCSSSWPCTAWSSTLQSPFCTRCVSLLAVDCKQNLRWGKKGFLKARFCCSDPQ